MKESGWSLAAVSWTESRVTEMWVGSFNGARQVAELFHETPADWPKPSNGECAMLVDDALDAYERINDGPDWIPPA